MSTDTKERPAVRHMAHGDDSGYYQRVMLAKLARENGGVLTITDEECEQEVAQLGHLRIIEQMDDGRWTLTIADAERAAELVAQSRESARRAAEAVGGTFSETFDEDGGASTIYASGPNPDHEHGPECFDGELPEELADRLIEVLEHRIAEVRASLRHERAN